MQGQPPAGFKSSRRGDSTRARGARKQAQRGAGAGGHHQGIAASDGEVELRCRECYEGLDEAVSVQYVIHTPYQHDAGVVVYPGSMYVCMLLRS